MQPFRVLIVFASSYGQTAKIADAIATRLRERGGEVDARPVTTVPMQLTAARDVPRPAAH